MVSRARAVEGGTSRRGTGPRTPPPTAHHVLSLQGLVGNSAVTAAITAQRDPQPGPPRALDLVDPRLDLVRREHVSAIGQVARWLDAHPRVRSQPGPQVLQRVRAAVPAAAVLTDDTVLDLAFPGRHALDGTPAPTPGPERPALGDVTPPAPELPPYPRDMRGLGHQPGPWGAVLRYRDINEWLDRHLEGVPMPTWARRYLHRKLHDMVREGTGRRLLDHH